jgi:hypothetical protein
MRPHFAGILAALLLAVSLLAAAQPSSPVLTDIHGVSHGPLANPGRAATVLFFITGDCPISNQYAPEISRICREHSESSVECFLVYVDPDLTSGEIARHQKDFSLECCAALHDPEHHLVEGTGARITPEAALLSPQGEVAYLGRINNFYAALGKPRLRPTVHDLRDALDSLLAGKPVETPRAQAIGCYIPPPRP